MSGGKGKIGRAKPENGAISLYQVDAEFPIYRHVVRDRLLEFLGGYVPRLRPDRRKILSKISLHVRPGETVGLVGTNGAGKTTLLKVISGLIAPSSGEVHVGGRVMALLAMGIGFRPNATGRENVSYGGLLLGMSRREIEARMDEIAEFSELGSAFDQPYFTYSSGMRARLGFSLATSVPADIIILDETLATGDQNFIGKCYQRIASLSNSGKTILFVSHNLGEVARMTGRALLLDQGRLLFDGPTFETMAEYDHLIQSRRTTSDIHKWESMSLQVAIETPSGERMSTVPIGGPCVVRIQTESPRDVGDVFLYVRVSGPGNRQLASYLTARRRAALGGDCSAGFEGVRLARGSGELRWHIDFWPGGEGTYTLETYIGPPIVGGLADVSQGRTWRGLFSFDAVYSNPTLRGAGTLFEIPVVRFEQA